MRLLVAGWNGFGQWGNFDSQIAKFVDVNMKNYLETSKDVFDLDFCIEWAFNVLIIDTEIFMKGFHADQLDKSERIPLPNNVKFTNCACNDKFVLFYNKTEDYVWKYNVDYDSETQWSALPKFLNTETEDGNETVHKIVCGLTLNLALSSSKRLFNIPFEIDTKHCVGAIVDVCCGHEHAILLTDQGNVYTWGNGSRCQLGHGNTENYEEPELVEALSGIQIVKITAGGWHCCALSADGDLYVWGWNERGQLGINPSDEDPPPSSPKKSKNTFEIKGALPNYALPQVIDIYDADCQRIEKNIVDVSCGSKHTVIKLDDCSFWGSGCNKRGQLGLGVDCVNSFVKLNVIMDYGLIKCGTWATVLYTN